MNAPAPSSPPARSSRSPGRGSSSRSPCSPPAPWPRVSIAWPLAVVAALIAIRLDRTEEAPFALHRAATLVGIERSVPRHGWRRYLPMERAGPDVVLSRPLNGVLLAAVLASFALVLVNLTFLALTAVLLAAYACVGRPERAWVPKHAVRTLRAIEAPAPDQVAPPTGPDGSPPRQPLRRRRRRHPSPLVGTACRRRVLPSWPRSTPSRGPRSGSSRRRPWRRSARSAIPRPRRCRPTTGSSASATTRPGSCARWRATTCRPRSTGIALIDPPLTTRPLADGRSARQVLADSLALIERFLRDAEMAAWERDVAALLTHERFLADRFAASSSLRVDRGRPVRGGPAALTARAPRETRGKHPTATRRSRARGLIRRRDRATPVARHPRRAGEADRGQPDQRDEPEVEHRDRAPGGDAHDRGDDDRRDREDAEPRARARAPAPERSPRPPHPRAPTARARTARRGPPRATARRRRTPRRRWPAASRRPRAGPSAGARTPPGRRARRPRRGAS